MIKFEDSICLEYPFVSDFSEGLALVANREHLYGYIDTEGKEVIPCQFTFGLAFKEGLAVVRDKDLNYGYIDRTGKLVIPFQFKYACSFSEGFAVVSKEKDLYGYIDSEGREVIEGFYQEARDFHDGFALVRGLNRSVEHYISQAGVCAPLWLGQAASQFSEGKAITKENTFAENGRYYIIDTNLHVCHTIEQKKMNIREISPSSCHMFRIRNIKGKYGYMNHLFEQTIPCIFWCGRNFHEDIAIVRFDDDIIGFIRKDGNMRVFSRNDQYSEIEDFSEGLAKVKNNQNLYGYIDSEGREVIECRYQEARDFHNGLAAVKDEQGSYYIDKNGIIKIRFPRMYCSILQVDNIRKEIKADTLESLKKALEETKLEIMEQLNKDISVVCEQIDKPKEYTKK